MADTPLHTLIMAARAEGGDEIADAAEAQLRGLMERDAEAQVAALREASGDENALAMASCAVIPSGTTWSVTFFNGADEFRSRERSLSAAIAAVRTAAQPVRAQAAE